MDNQVINKPNNQTSPYKTIKIKQKMEKMKKRTRRNRGTNLSINKNIINQITKPKNIEVEGRNTKASQPPELNMSSSMEGIMIPNL